MKEIFKLKGIRGCYDKDLSWNSKLEQKWNKVTFGKKSLKVFGTKIWSSLPYHIKSSQNHEIFEGIINN